MEKYLAPEAIGEGELSDQWLRFKREFAQLLVAVGKEEATEQVKLAIFLRIVGPRVNDLVETMRSEGNEDGRKFEVVSRKLDGSVCQKVEQTRYPKQILPAQARREECRSVRYGTKKTGQRLSVWGSKG